MKKDKERSEMDGYGRIRGRYCQRDIWQLKGMGFS
ncbi:TPA: hypothetical protein ACOGCP_001856 [Staphylococcus aureus]|nr:hypothetical protein [Staphylococcus aureus]